MERSKTTGYAPINGLNMYYEIYGEGGMPLILIHGGGSTIESNFANLLPHLQGEVIAVELQAHGRTGDRDAPESFTQDADDVAGLLKFLNINKANIWGFSNGGSTALQIAIRHPAIVNKIIVDAGAYRRDGLIPGFFDGMQNVTVDHMPAPLKEAYFAVNPSEEGFKAMFNKDRDRMVNFKDWPDDDLRGIKAPALLMAADKDVVTSEHILSMSRLIPNAQLAILPGIHGSSIGEVCTTKPGSKMPGITAALVGVFLDGE